MIYLIVYHYFYNDLLGRKNGLYHLNTSFLLISLLINVFINMKIQILMHNKTLILILMINHLFKTIYMMLNSVIIIVTCHAFNPNLSS